jgi:hypothetical protein
MGDSGGRRLDQPTRPNAAGAHLQPRRPTVLDGSNLLEIRIRARLGLVVGMTDVVPDDRPLAADITDP